MTPKHKRRPPKPRFVGFVASSVDGRISLAKNVLPDWTSAEDARFFQNSLEKYDAVVVGRNTFRAAEKQLRRRNTFVLSRKVSKIKKEGSVTFVNPGKHDLAKLLNTYKKIAVLGGSGVYQFMLAHTMLDELYVTIEPLIFGRGTPMFHGGSKTYRLMLRSSRRMNSKGTLLLHYEVMRGSSANG